MTDCSQDMLTCSGITVAWTWLHVCGHYIPCLHRGQEGSHSPIIILGVTCKIPSSY